MNERLVLTAVAGFAVGVAVALVGGGLSSKNEREKLVVDLARAELDRLAWATSGSPALPKFPETVMDSPSNDGVDGPVKAEQVEYLHAWAADNAPHGSAMGASMMLLKAAFDGRAIQPSEAAALHALIRQDLSSRSEMEVRLIEAF